MLSDTTDNDIYNANKFIPVIYCLVQYYKNNVGVF